MSMSMSSSSYDVVVIGGGPAGSTTSTLLAQHGLKVGLFEREKFPRFHIGESLIPETYWVLKRLNMLPKMQRSHFIKKYSVQFVNASGKLSAPFYFWDNKPHECSQTWQVVRSEFDQMMLDNAREHGVEAFDGVHVVDVLFEGDRAMRGPHSGPGRASRHQRQGRSRRERSGRDAAKPVQAPALGSDPQQGRDLDLLEGGVSRHRPRRGRDDGAPDRHEKRLVLVHPASRRHRQRRRGGAVRLPVQGTQRARADVSRGSRALSGRQGSRLEGHTRHRVFRDARLLVPRERGGGERLGPRRRCVWIPRSAVFVRCAAGAPVWARWRPMPLPKD